MEIYKFIADLLSIIGGSIAIIIGVFQLLDRFAFLCLKPSVRKYALPVHKAQGGFITFTDVPSLVVELKNHGRRPVYICEVFLLVNWKHQLTISPYELFDDHRQQFTIEPGRRKTAVFYGQQIVDQLPAHIGKIFSVRVVFVREVGKSFTSFPIWLNRAKLIDPSAQSTPQSPTTHR